MDFRSTCLIEMKHLSHVAIERLPEGVYLATSDDIPGLVAQGRTIAETLEIARDVARKLIEARLERQGVVGDVGDVGVISFIKECVYFSCF